VRVTPSAKNAAVEPIHDVPVQAPSNGKGAVLVEVPAAAPSREAWDWLWLLWERRRTLARAVTWGVAVSVLLAFVLPKRYDSTTRLMPPDQQSGSGLAMLAAMAGRGGFGIGSLAGDLLGMQNSGALFVDILQGRTVQDRIVDRFQLRKVYDLKYGIDARKRLANNTEIAMDRKSGIITIKVTDRDPHRAAQIAQAYVEELDRIVAEVSTSAARRERIFIEDRLKTVKQDLDRASQDFSQYASQNATLDISAQGKAMVEAAAKLQGELIAAQSELEGLEQIYTANNVRVRSLRARIEELQKQLQKLGGNSASTDTGATSTTAAAGVDGSNPAAFPSIRQLPLLGVHWADLYRQTKIEETVYELLTQQFELAKIQEAKEIPVVKVVDAADVPERRTSPKRKLIVIFGMFLSLSMSIVWVLGNTAWEQMHPEDPRKQLGQTIFRETATLIRRRRVKRAAGALSDRQSQ